MTARSEYDLDVLAAEVIQCYRRVTLKPALPFLDFLVCGRFPFTQGFFRGRGVLQTFDFAEIGTLVSISLPQRPVAERVLTVPTHH